MEDKKIRLDQYLANFKNISRTEAQELIINNKIKINNKIVNKKNYLIYPENTKIEINQEKNENIKKEFKLEPWNKSIDIIFEDKDLMIVNKESGMMVHPSSFNEEKTLAHAIKFYFRKNKISSELINDIRVGIAHRLDKNTSGLIIVAKTKKALDKLLIMFKNNQIEKTYLCLLHGILENSQIDVDAPIKRIDGTNKREVSQDSDAKDSFTTFKLIKAYKGFCLCKSIIKTGRTHQIRVHAKFIKHNVLNDPIYGISKNATKYGQFLVANKLKFKHPISNKQINFEIDMPKEFKNYIQKHGE